MDRKTCPPGFRPKGPDCVPQGPRIVPALNPTGGPTSSPWSNGGPQPQGCVPPLVGACFGTCKSYLCGFIVDPPGSVIQGNGSAIFGTVGVGGTLYQEPYSFNVEATVQATFREFTTATPNTLYAVGAFDSTGLTRVAALLFGTGVAGVSIGNTLFTGSWTPVPGAKHTVHAYALGGVGYLFLDGVAIPLTASGPSPVSFLPNSFGFSAFNFDMDSTAEFYSAFGANGAFPPSTIFCCPG
jgi:hypothetical protein